MRGESESVLHEGRVEAVEELGRAELLQMASVRARDGISHMASSEDALACS